MVNLHNRVWKTYINNGDNDICSLFTNLVNGKDPDNTLR